MSMPELVKKACYLYAEDDPYSRKLMEIIAEKVFESPNMTIFENSQDFMQRLKTLPRRPDIILLDIHMKPHNGFEVLKMIRDDDFYKKTKVIALTASVMNEEIAILKTSGFDGTIGKPFNIASFGSLIEQILNGKPVWQIT
jgi:twitching motility two-component system response regulator PilG